MPTTEMLTVKVRLPPHLNYHVVRNFKQPITASQLSHQTGMPVKHCNYHLTNLAELGFLRCLNPKARRSRLFWFTYLGQECHLSIRENFQLPRLSHDLPKINWKLYGEVCYSHRATVIKTLTRPMQPSEIKRMALCDFQGIRMSANNVRDVIRFLKRAGIVRAVRQRKKTHVLYELTEQGKHFQKLLMRAEVKDDGS